MSDEGPDDFGFGDGGFCKLYGDRLADSSLLECAVASRWIFLYMLARADSGGRFRCATLAGLARAAAVSLTEAERAIAELEAPDPDSSSPDADGCRIVRFPGGWQIVTYAKYRDYQTKRQRAEAARQRRHREAERRRQEAAERDMSRDVTRTYARNVKRQTSPTTATGAAAKTPTSDHSADIARFNRAFALAFNRRATLPPDKARIFADRVAAGYPVEFLIGLPVAVRAAGLDKGRDVQPAYLLRDGSGTYTREGATRRVFDWIGAIWQAADRLVLTPAHAEALAEVGALDWWRERGAKVQAAEEAEC